MQFIVQLIDVLLLYGVATSFFKSSITYGMDKPGFLDISFPAGSAIAGLFDGLYPWHHINFPLGKRWMNLSVTEKLKIRLQLHQLRAYAGLWAVIAIVMNLAATLYGIFTALHAVGVIAAYNCRPK